MTELYGRYHGRLLAFARTATADKAWRAKLRETYRISIILPATAAIRPSSAAQRDRKPDRAQRVALFRSDKNGSAGIALQAF